MAFLHGAETIVVYVGPTAIQVARAGVIALFGIAPIGPKNTLTVVNSAKTAAQFGEQVPGFNIPEALAAILAQGATTVLVVNVFDAVTNTATVNAEAAVVAAGKFRLAFAPIGTIAVTTSGAVALVAGTDYTVDAFGTVAILTRTTYPDGTALTVTYKKLDASTVTTAQLIGTIDNATNIRAGTKVFELAMPTYGFKPKCFIAPRYSTLGAISAELEILANKYRGWCIKDAPIGATYSGAIAARGPLGAFSTFQSSNPRTDLAYPHLKVSDPASLTGADKLVPYSAFLAGVQAAVINNPSEGFHHSGSNHQIFGITGTEFTLTADYTDVNAEVNQLNAVGITTVFSAFGTGVLTWGNRSAAFPSSNQINNFRAAQITIDTVAESVEMAMLPYFDKPLNLAIADTISETVNGFIRNLIQRKALIDGRVWVPAAENPVQELAAGHVTFAYDLCPPPPLERITFMETVNVNYLKQIVGAK